ncbi:putative protein kinase RLK-Pelle-LRR-Xb-1 family [Helianthus annuus]|nr:putative protein kinase RLK-Pelle-LRR-Xb-1 family [Helianthus annuus]
MNFISWVLFALFFCSCLGVKTLSQTCDPVDLVALKELALGLTNGSGLSSWSSDAICCHWDGVVCENDAKNVSKVAMLNLSAKGLKGVISGSISQLQNLRFLDLSYNQLEGELPKNLSNLKNLQVVNVSSNYLSGNLSGFRNFPNLIAFNLSNNSFSGEFNSQICNSSTDLRFLDLSMNNFTGNLENFHTCGKSIQELRIHSNSFSGDIPEFIYSFSSLKRLSLSSNNFSGELSTNLGNLLNLQSFVLFGNRFAGPLPNVFNYLTHLEELTAHTNSFSGPLPSTIEACSSLRVLDLRNNSLSGVLITDFSKFPNLCILDLGSNKFKGSLPISLSNCHELRILNLAKNELYGEIPVSYSNLSNLSFLSFSNNGLTNLPLALSVLQNCKNLTTLILTKNFRGEEIPVNANGFERLMVLAVANSGLTGQIPKWLIGCPKLEVLDLSWNRLNGGIPSWIGQMERLFYLDFSNNSLSGQLPKSLTELKSLVSLNIILLRMSRKKHRDSLSKLEDENYSIANGLSGGPNGSKPVFFPASGCKDLTVSNIVEATNNFSQSNIIGCGGFGLVYKATFPNGSKAAIKRLSGDCGQMEREFHAEVEALSRAQHTNLVSLKGYCKYGSDQLLIYSYMENGSLDYWLHERVDDEPPLTWRARLKIAKGAAHGLAYLHNESKIIHRDIKTSNILLNEKFKAHLADFGLSRLLCPYDTHVTTDLVGTLGYIPPEYAQTLIATFKGDVYSFGVVLLELITGRRPVEVGKGKNCRNLVSWVFEMKLESRYSEIFDLLIWDKSCENEMLEVLGIACKCLDQDPRRRPSIEQVVLWLDQVVESLC